MFGWEWAGFSFHQRPAVHIHAHDASRPLPLIATGDIWGTVLHKEGKLWDLQKENSRWMLQRKIFTGLKQTSLLCFCKISFLMSGNPQSCPLIFTNHHLPVFFFFFLNASSEAKQRQFKEQPMEIRPGLSSLRQPPPRLWLGRPLVQNR